MRSTVFGKIYRTGKENKVVLFSFLLIGSLIDSLLKNIAKDGLKNKFDEICDSFGPFSVFIEIGPEDKIRGKKQKIVRKKGGNSCKF